MEEITETDVCIIGSGLSGLSLAYFLKNIGRDVQIIEEDSITGGVLNTNFYDSLVIENGPQTFILDPEVKLLLKEIGIYDKIIFPKPDIKNRFVALKVNSKYSLKRIPLSLNQFIRTDLISFKSKFKILFDLFGVFPKKLNNNPSIFDLIKNRFGEETANKIASPAFIGIWASSIKGLGAKEILPDIYKSYREGKSIIISLIKNKLQYKKKSTTKHLIVTPKDGFISLVEELVTQIGKDKILINSKIKSINHESKWIVNFSQENKTKTIHAKSLILSTSSKGLSKCFNVIQNLKDKEVLIKLVDRINYSPIGIVHLLIPKDEFKSDYKGFGFLVPENHSKALLGCIFTGVLFPERNIKNKILLTCFVGGSIYPEMTKVQDPKVQSIVKQEITEVLNLKTDPEIISTYRWEEAIPQYEPKYEERLNKIKKTISEYPNLYICSNLNKGVSIPARIKNSLKLSSKISLNLN